LRFRAASPTLARVAVETGSQVVAGACWYQHLLTEDGTNGYVHSDME
jgi:hypothetical protein